MKLSVKKHVGSYALQRASGLLSELIQNYGLESTHRRICHDVVPCLVILNEPPFIILVSPISRWIHVKIIAKLPVAFKVILALERVKLINVG